MKKLISEFKAFALKGNALDLAVGVIIGAAFQAIVNSLVNDIISPVLGLFLKSDFSELHWNVFNVDIRYGAFITAIINFVIMAFIIFMMLKIINGLTSRNKKESEVVETPTTKICPYCKKEISIEATRCPYCTSSLD